MSTGIHPPRLYRYRIDFEGRIFHQESEITDPAVIRQLLRNVHRGDGGTFFSLCMGERNELVADDVLYVVAGLDDSVPLGEPGRLRVRCQGGLERSLDLATLELRGERHLYGDVEGGLEARFGRRAWLDLATRHVEVQAEGDAASLVVGDRRFPIRRLPSSRGSTESSRN